MTKITPERLKEIREQAQSGYAKGVISELLEEIDRLRSENDEHYLDYKSVFLEMVKRGERVEKLREALSFISCDGMDDGDFHTEEDITSGTIAMANRARGALVQDKELEDEKK